MNSIATHVAGFGQRRIRLDVNGLPKDYSKEELRHLMVEESGYLSEDFDRVIEEFHKTKGLFRSFHFMGFFLSEFFVN